MALERIPADIRYDGGVARMSDPEMIMEIKRAVTIPVMAKVHSFLNLSFLDSFS
jgi:pyridoxal 5'-phosphate synthase pdxS subunit